MPICAPRSLLAAVALLIALSAGALATTPAPGGKIDPAALPAVSTDPAAPLPLDPAIHVGKLPNGLTYYIRQNARPEQRAELWLVVDAGSVLEDDDQRGLAHLVEHMSFDGTRAFPKRAILEYLETIGMRLGPDVNASTSFDETSYTLRVPTDRPEFVDQGVAILAEWAGAVSFDPAEFERERGVVIEEWRQGRGAAARLRDQQLPVVLAGSRYADRLPIGTLASLQQAKREALLRFYRDWYRPDLMAVVAVGDWSAYGEARLEALIRQRFGGLANPRPERPRPVPEVPAHAETRFAIATDAEASQNRASIAAVFPRRPEQTVGELRRRMVESLYNRMLSGRLAELARRPDPPFLFAFTVSGPLVRPLESDEEMASAANGGLLRAVTALATESERARRFGFSAAELERPKANALTGLEKSFAERDKVDSARRAGELRSLFLGGGTVSGEAFRLALGRELLPRIDLAEINRYAAGLGAAADRVVEIEAPAKPGVAVPTAAELRQALASVPGADLAAWVDRTRDEPLVPHPPSPATVVAERRVAEIGVTEWQLSNGVRVVLKPTDFRNDEVLLSGWSPGGLSLVPDAAYTSGELATALVEAGGLGGFDPVTLQKALAGKSASAAAGLGDFEQTLHGRSSSRDVPTMLELAYLSITSPRRDAAAAGAAIARLKGGLENRSAQPQVAFADRMQQALHPADVRELPLTVERLAEVDYDTAFRLYRERFADASQLTVFLVGSFTLESIRPAVLTYLGGLPGAGRRETWRPVGGEPPAGVVRVGVVQGSEPKSSVEIVFAGDGRYSRENREELRMLTRLLQMRLREVLRDEMGAVYGVGVGGTLVSRPAPRRSVAVGFSCAPQKVEALDRAVFHEIEVLQTRGTDREHLDKVKVAEHREHETQLKENSFWLASLGEFYRSGWDPRDILRFDELVDRESSASLAAAAREYLPLDRYVLGVLSPEAAAARPH